MFTLGLAVEFCGLPMNGHKMLYQQVSGSRLAHSIPCYCTLYQTLNQGFLLQVYKLSFCAKCLTGQHLCYQTKACTTEIIFHSYVLFYSTLQLAYNKPQRTSFCEMSKCQPQYIGLVQLLKIIFVRHVASFLAQILVGSFWLNSIAGRILDFKVSSFFPRAKCCFVFGSVQTLCSGRQEKLF